MIRLHICEIAKFIKVQTTSHFVEKQRKKKGRQEGNGREEVATCKYLGSGLWQIISTFSSSVYLSENGNINKNHFVGCYKTLD